MDGLAAWLAVEMLQAQALRQLESVAESKKDDLERAREAWRDTARLISSRTQLRLSLRRFQETADLTERERMLRILDDARTSVRPLLYAAVLDRRGRVLVASGSVPEGVRAETRAASDPQVRVEQVGVANDGRVVVTLHEDMALAGVPIGMARVALDAEEIAAIARDYTGLGESGETLIVRADGDGGAEILTPLRQPERGPQDRRVPSDRAASPSLRAVRGESGSIVGVDDYSGREVWASTRALGRPGWGIVAKIDAVEAQQPALELRETLIRLALSLSALAIVAGFVLALFISRPIRELALVAGRIRAGEDGLRAAVDTEDEIGELARAFNAMTEELIAANGELARRIEGNDEDGPSGAP
jgi:HAMP domain-containing protein